MAKKRKYIMGSGIAISPEKDMALFKKMSKQGWHFSGMKMIWYRFEKGEPTDYDYASNMESKVTKDMISIYEESGWIPIIAYNGFQIFRAEAGATPIFSDLASEIESLEEVRRGFLKSGIIGSLICVPSMVILHTTAISAIGGNFLGNLPWTILWIISLVLSTLFGPLFVVNTVAFIGVCRILKRKRKQINEK